MNNIITNTFANSVNTAFKNEIVQSSRKLVNSDAKNIDEAAKQFEAMFIGQMLRPIFDTVEVSEVFGGGESEELWREVLVDEYGKIMAKRGGLHIADAMKKELLRIQEIQDKNSQPKQNEVTNG